MKKIQILLISLFVSSSFQILAQEGHIHSTPQQFQAFSQFPDGEALLMVNLVKFKDKVPGTAETGEALYHRYVKEARPFADKVNAEAVWYGKPLYTLVGPEDAVKWDAMFIIRYPNKNSFFQMMQLEGMPNDLRARALADSRLIACSEKGNFLTDTGK